MRSATQKKISFEQFIREKHQEKGRKINWEKRKKQWLSSVDSLYLNVLHWLNPFIAKSLLRTGEHNIELYEEQLGNYELKRLDIFLGNDTISLVPKGTLIFGAYGRVDLRGPYGEFILIEPQWNKWKIAIRTPKLQTWDFHKESFQDIFQKVTNGE